MLFAFMAITTLLGSSGWTIFPMSLAAYRAAAGTASATAVSMFIAPVHSLARALGGLAVNSTEMLRSRSATSSQRVPAHRGSDQAPTFDLRSGVVVRTT